MKTNPEEWYNSDRKLQYLHEVTDNGRGHILRSVFSEMSKKEYELGMDLAEFEQRDFYDFFNSGKQLRYDSIMRINSAIRGYRKWCSEHGMRVNKKAMESSIDVHAVSAMGSMFGNPSHLLNSLNIVFSHASQSGIEYIYRTYFWLAFMRFKPEDAFKIRNEHVDIASRRINYNGESYEIFSLAVPDIQMALSLTSLAVDMKRYSTMKERVSGDYILRGLAKNNDSKYDPENTMIYRPVISRAVNEAKKDMENRGEPLFSRRYNVYLTYTNVRLSGIFYEARMREKDGEDVKMYFRNIVDRDMGFSRDADMPKEEYSKRLLVETTTVKKYMDDYKRWKAAFQ